MVQLKKKKSLRCKILIFKLNFFNIYLYLKQDKVEDAAGFIDGEVITSTPTVDEDALLKKFEDNLDLIKKSILISGSELAKEFMNHDEFNQKTAELLNMEATECKNEKSRRLFLIVSTFYRIIDHF